MVVDAPFFLFQLFLTTFDAGDGDWHSFFPFFGLWILLSVSHVHVPFLSSFNFFWGLNFTIVFSSFVVAPPLTQLSPIQFYTYSFHLLFSSFDPTSIFPFVSYCSLSKFNVFQKIAHSFFYHLSFNWTFFLSCCSNILTFSLMFCLAVTLFSTIIRLLPFS